MVRRGTSLTLSQVVTDLATRLDDSSHVRWPAAQKNLAVKAAIRHAAGRWWEERVDDTLTYAEHTYRYAAPPACESVEAIYLEPLNSDRPRKFVVPTSYHMEGNYIVFDRYISNYENQTLYVHYFVYPSNLLTATASDGVTSGTGLTSAGGTFTTWGVLPGDEVEIIGDSGGPYYVASVTSETVLVLHKAPTAGTGLTYHVARYTDLPYEYLMFASMAELYEMASRNRPGVEVEENIRWATYYRQMADMTLNQMARHIRPQRRY